ncbi:MAG: hypothetical protein AAFN93_27495 [Bacteroidota bacterium]
MANLFKLFAETVKCVVLNACYSEVQAEAIATQIDTVIGMYESIGDKAAIIFSKGFYEGLGAGESVEFAYELGCNSLELQSIPEDHIPVLKRRSTNSVSPNSLEQPSYSEFNQLSKVAKSLEQVQNTEKVNATSFKVSWSKNEEAKENKRKGIRKWECVQTLNQKSGNNVVLFTPGSKSIIVASQKSIRILDPVTREQEYNNVEDIEGNINALTISTSGQYLISGGYDRAISIWDLQSKQLRKRIPSNQTDTKTLGTITSIACSSDCRYIYTGDTKGLMRVWDFDTENCLIEILCHSRSVGSIALNSKYNWLATCGDDKKVRVIDLSKNKVIKTLRDSDRIQSVIFSSDDNFLIYARE